jgi:FG-GAP-like repeat
MRILRRSARDASAAFAVRQTLILATLSAAFGAAYGCGDDSGGVAGGSGATGGKGGGGSSGTGGVLLDAGPAKDCSTQAACAPGVCVEGKCCPSAAQACAKTCCPDGQVCLFEQCVVPGASCLSQSDCGDGQYCETALGAAGGSGGGCGDLGRGRCVELPPVCGAPGAPDAGCVEDCEYHPPTGQLHPVKKWQWGTDNAPTEFPDSADVWSTPTVARVVDANCDGKIDHGDPPNVIFVSGDLHENCACGGNGMPGTLRVLDGKTGHEVWSLAGIDGDPFGFAGVSTALGDIDGDGRVDIVALTGDGYVAVIDANKNVLGVSDVPVEHADANDSFGWGGGIALGDMDGDGSPEIAFGRQVYSTQGGVIKQRFIGSAGNGGLGGSSKALSFFADLNGDGKLELVAGNTAYESNGTPLWSNSNVPDGFDAVADFNADGKPDVVVVYSGKLWILTGATGAIELGPFTLPNSGVGGPPTVADFDGQGLEIGIAQKGMYTMVRPDYAHQTLDPIWSAPNHDISSSETGSSVFDFDGDGNAEVVYNDECFLWVWSGKNGDVLFNAPNSSFTGTEASIVADVDGDDHAEIVMISNGVMQFLPDNTPSPWNCNMNKPDPSITWTPPPGKKAYRGITVWGDQQNSWVGTRSLWNQHAYSVSNVCDPADDACDAPNVYGSIPTHQKPNWSLPWLNNFRQNSQEEGIFNAPDATVAIDVSCASPLVVHVSVRNIGLSTLPAGVEAGVFIEGGATPTELGSVKTTHVLHAGQTEVLDFAVPSGASLNDTFFAKLLIDPANKTFNQCRDDNDESEHLKKNCVPVK